MIFVVQNLESRFFSKNFCDMQCGIFQWFRICLVIFFSILVPRYSYIDYTHLHNSSPEVIVWCSMRSLLRPCFTYHFPPCGKIGNFTLSLAFENLQGCRLFKNPSSKNFQFCELDYLVLSLCAALITHDTQAFGVSVLVSACNRKVAESFLESHGVYSCVKRKQRYGRNVLLLYSIIFEMVCGICILMNGAQMHHF